MAGRMELRLGANTTDIKKSFLDLNRTLKSTLGKSKVSIFSEDTKKFLKSEAKNQLSQISQRTVELSKRAELYAQALKKGVDNVKDELRYKERLLKITNQLATLEDQKSTISSGLGGGKGGAGGLGGLLGKFAKNPATWAIAAAMGAYKLGSNAFGAYEQTMGSRLKLRGRGVSDLSVTDLRFAKLGMGAEDVNQARLGAMGVYGREGATQEAVRRRSLFEKAQGLDSGTMLGIGAQLRPVMGTEEARRAETKIQAAQLASGVTDAIGPYLETAANMLTELNKNGFALNNEALTAFNILMKESGGKQSERMGKLLMGMDSAVRGSTGEANAFMQMAAAKAGFGGGTVGGLQAVIRSGGMFGLDVNKYKTLSGAQKAALTGLGIGRDGYSSKMAGGMQAAVNAQFGSPEQIEKIKNKTVRDNLLLGRGRFFMNMGMAGNEASGMEIDSLTRALSKATGGEKEKIEARLKTLQGESPEQAYKHWNTIANSSENQYRELQTQTQLLMVLAGEKIAPIAMLRDKAIAGLTKEGAIAAGIIKPSELDVSENRARHINVSKREFTARERMLGLGGLPEKPTKKAEVGMSALPNDSTTMTLLSRQAETMDRVAEELKAIKQNTKDTRKSGK